MPEATMGLLDTSVVVDHDLVDPALLPDESAISAITLAELAAGPHATGDEQERARRQDRLQWAASMWDPLPFDSQAARLYGRVFGETINYYVRNNPEMAEVVANPQRYIGQVVRVFSGSVLVTLRGEEMHVSPAFRVELVNAAPPSSPTSEGDGDEAIIRGCQDDVIDVYVTKRTISGDGPSTYQMQIQNVHRGNLKTGRTLEAFWDGEQPKVGNQYIMGRVKDGFFHVDPTISYPYTCHHDKAGWIFRLLQQ